MNLCEVRLPNGLSRKVRITTNDCSSVSRICDLLVSRGDSILLNELSAEAYSPSTNTWVELPRDAPLLTCYGFVPSVIRMHLQSWRVSLDCLRSLSDVQFLCSCAHQKYLNGEWPCSREDLLVLGSFALGSIYRTRREIESIRPPEQIKDARLLTTLWNCLPGTLIDQVGGPKAALTILLRRLKAFINEWTQNGPIEETLYNKEDENSMMSNDSENLNSNESGSISNNNTNIVQCSATNNSNENVSDSISNNAFTIKLDKYQKGQDSASKLKKRSIELEQDIRQIILAGFLLALAGCPSFGTLRLRASFSEKPGVGYVYASPEGWCMLDERKHFSDIIPWEESMLLRAGEVFSDPAQDFSKATWPIKLECNQKSLSLTALDELCVAESTYDGETLEYILIPTASARAINDEQTTMTTAIEQAEEATDNETIKNLAEWPIIGLPALRRMAGLVYKEGEAETKVKSTLLHSNSGSSSTKEKEGNKEYNNSTSNANSTDSANESLEQQEKKQSDITEEASNIIYMMRSNVPEVALALSLISDEEKEESKLNLREAIKTHIKNLTVQKVLPECYNLFARRSIYASPLSAAREWLAEAFESPLAKGSNSSRSNLNGRQSSKQLGPRKLGAMGAACIKLLDKLSEELSTKFVCAAACNLPIIIKRLSIVQCCCAGYSKATAASEANATSDSINSSGSNNQSKKNGPGCIAIEAVADLSGKSPIKATAEFPVEAFSLGTLGKFLRSLTACDSCPLVSPYEGEMDVGPRNGDERASSSAMIMDSKMEMTKFLDVSYDQQPGNSIFSKNKLSSRSGLSLSLGQRQNQSLTEPEISDNINTITDIDINENIDGDIESSSLDLSAEVTEVCAKVDQKALISEEINEQGVTTVTSNSCSEGLECAESNEYSTEIMDITLACSTIEKHKDSLLASSKIEFQDSRSDVYTTDQRSLYFSKHKSAEPQKYNSNSDVASMKILSLEIGFLTKNSDVITAINIESKKNPKVKKDFLYSLDKFLNSMSHCLNALTLRNLTFLTPLLWTGFIENLQNASSWRTPELLHIVIDNCSMLDKDCEVFVLKLLEDSSIANRLEISNMNKVGILTFSSIFSKIKIGEISIKDLVFDGDKMLAEALGQLVKRLCVKKESEDTVTINNNNSVIHSESVEGFGDDVSNNDNKNEEEIEPADEPLQLPVQQRSDYKQYNVQTLSLKRCDLKDDALPILTQLVESLGVRQIHLEKNKFKKNTNVTVGSQCEVLSK